MNTTFSRTVSWHRRGALLLAGFLLAAASVTGASGQTAPMRVGTILQPPPSPEPPALDIRNNAIQLSVDRAIEIALQRNLAIVIQRYTRVQQRLAIIEALGLYDLNATIDAIASNDNQPAATRFEASQVRRARSSTSASASARPQGGSLRRLGWNNRRSQSDSPQATSPPPTPRA